MYKFEMQMKRVLWSNVYKHCNQKTQKMETLFYDEKTI